MPSIAPATVEEATSPEWIGWALSQNHGPVDVISVDIIEQIGPSATAIRLKPEFAGGRPENLPETYCLKGMFKPELTSYLENGTQASETGFFRDVLPNVTVHSPAYYYAGYDPDTKNGVVILEDLVPAGVKFLGALSPYTLDQMASSLDQYARLHGGTWGEANLARYPWALPRIRTNADNLDFREDGLTEFLKGPRGDYIPDEMRDGHRLFAAVYKLADQPTNQPYHLIHGDPHAGNLFQSANGQVGLIDWQTLQRGQWPIEIAYHIGATLDVEVRRKNEKDLLRYYLDRLAEYGGQPPTWDEAWVLYKQSVPYGFWMWAVTRRVVPEIIQQFCTRLGTSAADHRSHELLGV